MRRSKADAQQTRTAVLDAAEALFAAKGFASVTLEMIARHAGVTRGAIYWHFKDKSDLLHALIERYRPPQVEVLKAALAADHGDPLRLLQELSGEVLALYETEPSRQRMFLILVSLLPAGEGETVRAAADEEMFALLNELMERARATDTLAPDLDPKDAAVSLMVFMNGLLHEWLRSGKAFSLTGIGGKLSERHLESLRAKAV